MAADSSNGGPLDLLQALIALHNATHMAHKGASTRHLLRAVYTRPSTLLWLHWIDRSLRSSLAFTCPRIRLPTAVSPSVWPIQLVAAPTGVAQAPHAEGHPDVSS